MKHLLFLSALLLSMLTFRALGETLVISNGETNSIVVATNEAIIIDFIDSNSNYPVYRRGGVSKTVDIMRGSGFAGPAELIFGPSSTVVTFHRLQTVAVTTVVLVGGSDTNTIVVPTNKTLKIFATSGPGTLVISRGTHVRIIDNMDEALRASCELTGPLTVIMTGFGSPGDDYQRVFTYYFTEDFVQATADGYIKGPTGTFEVLVEKSTDLAQWLPVMIQPTSSSDARAFYRLRIQK